jgi:hypothetical protein
VGAVKRDDNYYDYLLIFKPGVQLFYRNVSDSLLNYIAPSEDKYLGKLQLLKITYDSLTNGRTTTPFSCKYRFTSRTRNSPKWKMEAAKAASAPPTVKPS